MKARQDEHHLHVVWGASPSTKRGRLVHFASANTVNGRGYDGHLKYTICDSCRPCHSILSILKPVFFAKVDIFVVVTTRSGTYISRFGDICVHDDDDDTTHHFTPVHAHRVKVHPLRVLSSNRYM